MFSEIVELVGYAVKAFSTVRDQMERRGRYRHGWRALYDLYLNIDEITRAAVSSLDAVEVFDSHAEDDLNERLDILSKAVKGFVGSFRHVYDALAVYDEELQWRLEVCLEGKNWWYRKFAELYSAGAVDKKSKKITKKCLRMSFNIDKWRPNAGSYHHIDGHPEFQQEVTLEQEVDLSTPAKMERLIEEGRRNVTELNYLKQRLRKYLIENCSLRDLLGAS